MAYSKKLILLLFLFPACTSIAQNGMYAGIKAGFHNSTLFFENTSEVFRDYPEKQGGAIAYAITPGYKAYLNVGFMLSYRWSINFGVGYSSAGQSYSDVFQISSGPLAVDHSISLGYLNIPALIRYSNYDYGDKAAFALSMGPRFGFMVVANETLTFNGEIDEGLGDPFIKYSNIDVGIEINPGIDIYFQHRSFLSINLHSYIGLTNLNTDYFEQFPTGGEKIRSTRNLQLGIQVGYHWIIEQRYR